MLYQQLKQIRGLLRRREIKLSDALLIVLRYLRNRLPGERLIWLNRELLGYCKDDLPSLYERPRLRQQFSLFRMQKTVELEVPEYRFLTGNWGRLGQDGQLICVQAAHLSDQNIFCNIGIQQIETQLQEIDNPGTNMFSMSSDELTGSEFYCWSTELVRVYDAVRQKLCEFIETVIEELKLPSNER
jgi:hypothetical protein